MSFPYNSVRIAPRSWEISAAIDWILGIYESRFGATTNLYAIVPNWDDGELSKRINYMPIITNGPGAVALAPADRVRAVTAIKARLRVISPDEDDLIAAFAETALGLAERVTGQATIARPMSQALTKGADWQRLAARPVRSIDTVADADGVALPVGAFAVDIDAEGMGWVRIGSGQAARVTFVAGVAEDWDALPPALREGAAMLAAHLFDDRTGTNPIPAAVGALWRPFRTLAILGGARAAGTRA